MPQESSAAPAPESPQEQIIPPALRRRLQECYEHGTKLMAQDKYDFDYAHSILVECVSRDSGNLVYLDTFFQNLHRKYDNNKRGSMLNFGGKGPFKKAVAKQDWKHVVKLGPQLLKSNPWDVPTLRALADACAAFGFHETELRYLKNALAAKPNDPDVNRHCAKSLERIGQFDQAIACWHRIDEAKRGDDEAQEMMSKLQIAKTMGHNREDKTAAAKGRERKPPSDADEEAATETKERREIKLSPRQQLEQAISNNPTDPDSYIELAELHIAENRLGEAAHLLAKAVSACGGDLKVRERLEDLEVFQRQTQLAVAEQRAASNEDEEARQLAEQLRADLNRYELEVFGGRAERYPNDREVKFQLGLRLKRADNLRQAIACFQESMTLPERYAGSLLELGECLQRGKQYEKALECYTRSVDESAKAELLDLQKLAHYRSGLLAAGLRNYEMAEAQLAKLIELDSAYKDAADRLDKIREIRHKG
jgi:tetratricopeptide (TPR) repeat protein